ncbi:MAG: methionine biosynthesis protein MetW [Planctomycetota bacterium]|nr:methionine biosynthesis protein MetW [Planctomycetota bacterium]MDA1210876.1 methionine biosynthesis protein MetW [Planctomycetota bacterium]
MASRYRLPDPRNVSTDQVILEQIPNGRRVVDLGCGDGRLMVRLRDERDADVLGIEVDEDQFIRALGKGLPVIRTDLDKGLNIVPSGSFDFSILSQTLQEVRHPTDVLCEMLRIAHQAIVVVPNFGHWKVRRQVILQGRAPVTDSLPYEWHNTPNLHFMSMHDMRELAETLNFRIVAELPIIGGRAVKRAWAANLRAESALYILQGNLVAEELRRTHSIRPSQTR